MCFDFVLAETIIGEVLIVLILFVWALHNHIFILIAYVLGCVMRQSIHKMHFGAIPVPDFYAEYTPSLLCFGVPGAIITPITVVYLLNNVGQFDDEIQSWQIGYISWGCCTGLLWIAVVLQQQNIFNKIDVKKWMLYPFHMAPNCARLDLFWWATPLIATAPATVIGFLANHYLDEKLQLI